MIKPHIAIVSTGGTIVSSGASDTQMTGYSIQGLKVDDLIVAVPSLDKIAKITVHPVCNIPSSCINEAIWGQLCEVVQHLANNTNVDGIVITHGTDTMEETAFFLNLVLKTNKPVVITGAMRPATALSADGPLNLYNAVQVAGCEEACGKGVLIILNGLITGARDTTKTNTTSVQTFQSRDFGAYGYVIGSDIEFFSQSTKPHTLQTAFTLESLLSSSGWPRVDIVYTHGGEDGLFIDAAVKAGAKGIVYAGTGHGTVSEKAEEALVNAVKSGVIVVRASRTGSGLVLDGLTRWQDAGFIPSRSLSPQKARILLELSLAQWGSDQPQIAKAFKTY